MICGRPVERSNLRFSRFDEQNSWPDTFSWLVRSRIGELRNPPRSFAQRRYCLGMPTRSSSRSRNTPAFRTRRAACSALDSVIANARHSFSPSDSKPAYWLSEHERSAEVHQSVARPPLSLNSKSAMSGVVDGALIAAFWYSQHHDISMKYMRDKIAAVMSNEEMQARTLPSLMKSRSAWARNARRFPPIVVIQAFRGDNRTTDGPWRSSWYVVIGSSKT